MRVPVNSEIVWGHIKDMDHKCVAFFNAYGGTREASIHRRDHLLTAQPGNRKIFHLNKSKWKIKIDVPKISTFNSCLKNNIYSLNYGKVVSFQIVVNMFRHEHCLSMINTCINKIKEVE